MDELQLLEQLLNELLAGIQDVLMSGEILSDEFQGMLAQELEATTNRIDQLRAEQGQQAPPIDLAPSNDSQLLWVLSGQQPQAFISYLRTFPSNETRQLLNNPNLLSQTIDRLNQMMPSGQPLPVEDGIERAPLNSSNVWGAMYNPKTGKMKVRFQGGSVYEYSGVPVNIFNAFIHGNASARTRGQNQYGRWWPSKNPSLGAALNQYIKRGNFPYRRLS